MVPFIYTDAHRRTTETLPPSVPARRQRTSFSRQAVFGAFGAHHAKAIDQASFIDHVPGARMRLAPGSWFQQ